MAITLKSSGGGSVTIDPISTSNNTSISLPDTSGGSIVVSDSSGNISTANVTFTGNVNLPSVNGGQLAGLRNKIINGNMGIAQRGTAAVTAIGYGPADRWYNEFVGDTFSATLGSFVSGDTLYDTGGAQSYSQVAITSVAAAGNYMYFSQRIEDVRLLAGQTITVSFWAKAAAGTPSIGISIDQYFGTGGSPSAVATGTGQAQALTTTWTKYSKTFTVPSINGKTIGTAANTSFSALVFWLDAGSSLNTRSGSIGQSSKTVSIAQVQLEIGAVATPFEQRPIGMELALCQRYYYRLKPNITNGRFGVGYNTTTTQANANTQFPVTMRVAPSALEQTGTAADYSVTNLTGVTVCSSVPTFGNACTDNSVVTYFSTGLVAGQGINGVGSNANAYLGWSAEL